MVRNSIFSKLISSCKDLKTSNSKLFYSNKAISPVVATALLLVVAVVAVVGFQSWFGSYSSGVFSDIEIQSNSALDGTLKIESLIGDILYIINNIQDNLSITTLKIGGNLCTVTNNLTLGMNEVPVSSCVSNLTTSTPDIVLITEKNVISKTVYVKDSVSSSSSSLSCPTGYIPVPGNGALGTSNFCVMKYEAKNDGGVPNSTASGNPWVSITQTNAIAECESLGVGYHLITNAEWVTIARNAENVNSNWNSSIIGTGFMFSGHNDNGPSNALNASNNDNDGYYRTNDNLTSCDGVYTNFAVGDDVVTGRACAGQRRTLTLSNGEVIWDLGGNVWEWNNDTLNTTGTQNSSLGTASSNWYEWDVISGYSYLKANDITLNAINGIGRVYTDTNIASDGGDVHAFLRGGLWYGGAYAGAFALYLNNGPSYSSAGVGFRCSYAP